MLEYKLKSPIAVQVELTNNCNHRCDYCYNHSLISPKLESLPDHHFVQIINTLGDGGVFDLTLTGGEPLLRKDAAYACMESAKKYNMILHMNTNLTAKLTADDAVRLKKFNVGILASMPGSTAAEYNQITHSKNFESFLRNVVLLKHHDIFVALNTVLTKRNIREVRRSGEFAASLGVDSFSATPMIAAERWQIELAPEASDLAAVLEDLLYVEKQFSIATDLLESLPICALPDIRQYKKFTKRSCAAGKSLAVVDPSGNLRACNLFRENVGNILADGLAATWARLDDWKTGKFLPQACEPCLLQDMCGTGCRVQANTFGGCLRAQSPWYKEPITSAGALDTLAAPEPLNLEKTYILPKNILFRQEREGVYVIYCAPEILTINKEFLRFIQYLMKKKQFTPAGILKEYGNNENEKLISLLTLLKSRRIICEIKNGRST